MAFVIRTFDYSESLGEKLKAVRQSARLTLSEVAERTKIRKSLLKALEDGDYARLPDPIYTRNFLKIYVRSLGGDVAYFLKQFEDECSTCDFTQNACLPRRRARAFQFLVASRFVKTAGICAVVLMISGYFAYHIQAIISPPALFVYEPTDNIMTDAAIITITGEAEDGARVRVNNIDVLLSTDGTFEVEVALERGLNIIAIESTKRYSKSTTQYRRVVLGQNNSITLQQQNDRSGS